MSAPPARVRRVRFGQFRRGITALAVVASACARPAVPKVDGLPDVVDFNFHVKPILSDRCFACHGPDDRARKAGLRLDRKEGAFRELESGNRAVVPGSPRESALVERILSSKPDFMMPAPASHLTLNDYEKALLVRWIEQGAKWKPHWSFIPPEKPPLPDVKTKGWARNEIDRFILAKLEARGWTPSSEASRETLIRRVSFDLTGLPPTIEEIDAFLADRSPNAYEHAVDRLLASPAYGERMASEWLDVARYADSHGYQDDGMRTMWPWRDWVISAFNRNIPFDRFITWQLAGDLLPNPTDEQLLATGFNRNHMQSQEGGIVSEEYRTEYVVDRVNTFGRAFLGISVECARCHDHKYDPVLQREFYQLFSFFNNVNETGQIPYAGSPSPTVIVKDDEAQAKLAALREKMRPLEAGIRVDNPAFDEGFEAWLRRLVAGSRLLVADPPGLIGRFPLDRSERKARPKEEEKKKDEKKKDEEKNEPARKRDREPKFDYAFANTVDPDKPAWLGGDKERVPETVAGMVGGAQRLLGDSHIEMAKKFALFERNEPFSLALWFRIDERGASGPLVTRSGGLFNGNRGYEIILRENGTFTAGLHHVFPANSIEIETLEPAAPGNWHHLALTYDGSSRAAGIRLFIDGRVARSRITVDHLLRSIIKSGGYEHSEPPPLRIGRRHDETLEGVSVDEFRVYDRQLTSLEVAGLSGVEDPAGEALASAAPGTLARAALREHYVLRVASGFGPALAALTRLRGRENDLLTSLPDVMIMRELPQPRQTFVLTRGAYDAPTTRVTPGTPAAIRPFPDSLPKNRLGLARWLLDPKHPLTARVLVNRYWAMFFGRGIVPTLADFGSQGRLPTHPELLDWLATTFVESGWDLKALQKRIVMSATYRQSSIADARLREQDPANEWLARGPAYRMSAEQIHDNALAASGLLFRKIGGPSVYPYQPEGLWKELGSRFSSQYKQSEGEDLYRRSLYTVWRRSSPPPSAISFDAAERFTCTVQRQRTTTPLQSLVLMNDPQYVEASRVLAARMVQEGGATPADRITFGFRLLTTRRPTPEELRLLERLYEDERIHFREDRSAALKLLGVGERRRDPMLDPVEVASYTVVATTVMNFDEAVFRR